MSVTTSRSSSLSLANSLSSNKLQAIDDKPLIQSITLKFTEVDKDNHIKTSFKTYDAAGLSKFSYFCDKDTKTGKESWRHTRFKESQEGVLEFSDDSKITYALFDDVFQLFAERKELKSVITAEKLIQNPYLIDDYAKVLFLLHPEEETNSFIFELKKKLDRTLTLEVAELILENHSQQYSTTAAETVSTTASSSSSSSSSSTSEKGPLPFLVAIARKKVIQSKLFATPAEATEHFETLQSLEQEKEFKEDLLRKEELQITKYPITSHAYKRSLAIIAKLKSAITMLTELITNQDIYQNKDLALLTDLKMIEVERLSGYQESKSPFLQKIARVAKERLDFYTAQILAAFECCKADMSRQDLLKHVIGPGKYLFDDYKITVHPSNTNPSHFVFKTEKGQVIKFYLKERSLFEFKRQIYYTIDPKGYFDERTIPEEEKIITRKVSAEATAIREAFKDWGKISGYCEKNCLSHASQATKKERDQIKTKLIQYLGWDKEGITHNDIVVFVDAVVTDRIKITLKEKQLAIYLSLYDCSTMFGNLWECLPIPTVAEVLKCPKYVSKGRYELDSTNDCERVV